MTNIRVLLVVFGFQCVFPFVIAENSKYSRSVSSNNSKTEEPANLTPQQEHEILLKQLLQKGGHSLTVAFTVEIFANGIGNDFFEFTSDEKASLENKAIVKAAFHCFTRLLFQVRVTRSIEAATRKAAKFVKETAGNMGDAYTKVCAKINDDLKNETIYTAFRDEYKKQAQTTSKKTYQYGIPKSEDDLRKSFAELANDPRSKKLNAYYTFSFFILPEEVYNRQAILELAGRPGKLEAVQKIYEESTDEIIPLVEDISPAKINIDLPLNINLSYLRATLGEKLLSKIKANPDLKEDFERIHERIRNDYLGLSSFPKSSN